MPLSHGEQVNLTYTQLQDEGVDTQLSCAVATLILPLSFQFGESLGITTFRNFLMFSCFIQATHILHTTSPSETRQGELSQWDLPITSCISVVCWMILPESINKRRNFVWRVLVLFLEQPHHLLKCRTKLTTAGFYWQLHLHRGSGLKLYSTAKPKHSVQIK